MRKRYLFILLLAFSAVYAFTQPVTITPPSANIQPGQSVTLTASGALYYQWSPATGLSTTDGPVTVASPTVTTTYTCSGYAPGAESVANGDFTQGNVGFTSAYEYNTNLWGEGTYYVDSDASLHHENFFGYGHGDNGNFMIVNGATIPGTNVWTEQISVVPNTYYAFSTWVCTLAGQASEVALLQFSINGNQLGNIFSAPPERYVWEQFYELWYSGSSTTATITILNQNTVGSGNDFGLDDISFCELVLVGAPQCTVYVGSMSASASADDTELCEGESTTLHALPVNGSGNYTYSWTPANTLDNPSSQHPVATPALGTTTYTCHVSDVSWGNSQDVSVTIVVHPNAEHHIEEAICSGESYNFLGEVLTNAGEYEHTLQTQYGCDSLVHLTLTVYPPNDTTIVDPSICVGQTFDFHGTLYDQNGQVAYFDTIDNHGCLKVEKLILTVGEYQMPPVQEEYVCYGHDEEPYFRWDKNNVVYTADTYDEVIVPDPNGGCDFKYRLNLKFHQEFYIELPPVDTCDQYKWPVTGEIFTTTNHHIERTFPYYFGDKVCDSTYVLDITINESSTQESYTYDGEDDDEGRFCDTVIYYNPNIGETLYFDHDIDTMLTGETPSGCLYEIAVHIKNINYAPHPYIVSDNPNPHYPITATEFNVNRYTYTVKDDISDISKWKIDQCKWEISKESWYVVPNPSGNNPLECTVYAMDWVPDPICLSFKAVNNCDSVIATYMLYPSFYGVDEYDATPSDFSIIPNPNDGQMTLIFNNFEGKVEVKVYDMMGNLIDDFETYNDMESRTLEYNLHGAKGIYFIVANGKEGTMAKKVVIR
jgi:hypothetical protein